MPCRCDARPDDRLAPPAAGAPTMEDLGAAAVLAAPVAHARGGSDRRDEPALAVFSGGTAFNAVSRRLKNDLTADVCHILPVSDDGGSTAEICRVLGGPAVGDIRSRCLRLADDSTEEARAVNALLAHRLHARDSTLAKGEWYHIVEGEHPLWHGISEPYKNTIRAFLVHFHANILRHATQRFDFSNGSIGNFFFAGARIFFRSLEAAVFLYSRVSGIPEGSLVLPCVCTEDRLTLGAELADGTIIRGQNEISHPHMAQSPHAATSHTPREKEGLPSPSPSPGNCVDKSAAGGAYAAPLHSPIDRVMYLSYEGMTYEHEIRLSMNPRVKAQLQRADGIVYGMGSLYTSLCPSLVLDGVGECIAATNAPKVRSPSLPPLPSSSSFPPLPCSVYFLFGVCGVGGAARGCGPSQALVGSLNCPLLPHGANTDSC